MAHPEQSTAADDPLAAMAPAVRGDLLAGHRSAWRHVASPGCWYSGAQRVAIAKAVRQAWDCALCTARKAALSPQAAHGTHHGKHLGEEACVLTSAETDAVHRMVRDQARLSRSWVEELTSNGALRLEAYVELIGVVTQVVSLDVLHRALGLELAPLPAPLPGAPTEYLPPGLAMEDAWVPMIASQNLGPAEADLFGDPTGNVVRALSAVPDEVRAMKSLSAAQYIAIAQMRDFVGGARVGRTLSRAQMELIAGRVSALHECFY